MPNLVILWILIMIPYTGIVSVDKIKALCEGIDKKVIVDEIVINDRAGNPHYAFQVKCFKIKGIKT